MLGEGNSVSGISVGYILVLLTVNFVLKASQIRFVLS